MAVNPRPNWQKDVVRCAYAVLRDEVARRQHCATIPYAELADRLFRQRHSSLITHALKRGQIPSRLTLQRIEVESEAARRLLELVPVFTPKTPAKQLRESFANALADLQASPYVVDIARTRDIDLMPGAIRNLHSPRWVSRLILEAIQLRRYASRGLIRLVLAQGWNTAAALLDCVAEFPTVPELRELAKQLWGVAADNYLPDVAAIKQGAAVIEMDLKTPTIKVEQCRWSLRERTSLQECVAETLSRLDTPLRIPRLFPRGLGAELYFHFTYQPPPSVAETAPPKSAAEASCPPPTPITLEPHVRIEGRGDVDGIARRSGLADLAPTKTPERAGERLPPPPCAAIPQRATCIKRPTDGPTTCVRPRRRARLLWDADVEPILLDSDLTKSFRVRNSLMPT